MSACIRAVKFMLCGGPEITFVGSGTETKIQSTVWKLLVPLGASCWMCAARRRAIQLPYECEKIAYGRERLQRSHLGSVNALAFDMLRVMSWQSGKTPGSGEADPRQKGRMPPSMLIRPVFASCCGYTRFGWILSRSRTGKLRTPAQWCQVLLSGTARY